MSAPEKSCASSSSQGRSSGIARQATVRAASPGIRLEAAAGVAERSLAGAKRHDGDHGDQRRDQRDGDRPTEDRRHEHGNAGDDRADEADEGVLGRILPDDVERLLEDLAAMAARRRPGTCSWQCPFRPRTDVPCVSPA